MESSKNKSRIAIVEDESIVAMDLKKLLNESGYEISFIVDSGEMAIQMMENNRTDAVLMDIQLKGTIDGIQAASHIINTYNVPVVFLTAFDDEVTVKRAMKLKNYGFIVKPYVHNELKKAIEGAATEREIRTSGIAKSLLFTYCLICYGAFQSLCL